MLQWTGALKQLWLNPQAQYAFRTSASSPNESAEKPRFHPVSPNLMNHSIALPEANSGGKEPPYWVLGR